MTGPEKIAGLLSSQIPKQFWLYVENRFLGALARASQMGASSALGHRRSIVGMMRHFLLNEAAADAFADADFEHSPVRGNRIVFGSVGIVTIARLHLSKGPWDNSRRSAGKRKLCERNVAAARLVQPDLLEGPPPDVTELTVFLVTVGDGSVEEPATLHIVVPNADMDLRNPIFVEPLSIFLQRYEKIDVPADNALPRLKPGVKANPLEAANDDLAQD